MTPKRGIRTTPEMGCRTPGKRGFETLQDLQRGLCREPIQSGYKPYRCTCGYWHLTTNRKRVKRGVVQR